MRFKNVFSIIGPAMIGPSSSHTAGALRIGSAVRQLLGETPIRAEITFFGSYAQTYEGHGTDLAIVGGLLGMPTDDERIRDSHTIAAAQQLQLEFRIGTGHPPHPNTAKVQAEGAETTVEAVGISIGGGNIRILSVNGFEVDFGSELPVIVLAHQDRPGVLARVTRILSKHGINIAYMDVDRKGRNGEAMTVMEVDGNVTAEAERELIAFKMIQTVRIIRWT